MPDFGRKRVLLLLITYILDSDIVKLRAEILIFKSEFTELATKQSNLVINLHRKVKAHQDPARNLPATPHAQMCSEGSYYPSLLKTVLYSDIRIPT